MGGKPTKQQDLGDVAMDLKMQGRMMEKQAAKLEGGEKALKKKILDVSDKHSTHTLLGFEQKPNGNAEDGLPDGAR